MKLLEQVLHCRILEMVNIDEVQFCFVPGRGTTDAIIIVHQWQEKYIEAKKPLYFAFVDLEKAFDRVPRKILGWALTHWGRMMHICVIKVTIISSDNGLWPDRCQAIIWTNAGKWLIGPLGTNFDEILIKIHTFSFKKIHLKMSSGKWGPFCLGLNVLRSLGVEEWAVWVIQGLYSKARSHVRINGAVCCSVVGRNSILCSWCMLWVHKGRGGGGGVGVGEGVGVGWGGRGGGVYETLACPNLHTPLT